MKKWVYSGLVACDVLATYPEYTPLSQVEMKIKSNNIEKKTTEKEPWHYIYSISVGQSWEVKNEHIALCVSSGHPILTIIC